MLLFNSSFIQSFIQLLFPDTFEANKLNFLILLANQEREVVPFEMLRGVKGKTSGFIGILSQAEDDTVESRFLD